MKNLLSLFFFLLCGNIFSQIINIPDANFKYLLTHSYPGPPYNGYDTNNDGEIDVSEAQNIVYLSIYNRHIHDLTGIRSFTNLKVLDCSNNFIQNLDLQNLLQLEELRCSYNNNLLTNININGCTSLKIIKCGNNQFTTLDFSGINSLEEVDCEGNTIHNLDFSNQHLLKKVNALNSYQLQTINFDNCTALENIQITEAPLNKIILDNLGNLKYVTLNNNTALQTLELNALPNLTFLECYNGQLNDLNISAAPNLLILNCSHNKIDKLDINNLDYIKSIDCSYNNLTNLIINNPNFKELFYIICSYNKLTGLTIKQPILGLNCDFNYLTSLDLSNQTQMGGFSCSNNPVEYINLMDSITSPYFYSAYINLENCPRLKFVCANSFQKDNLDAYFYSINRSNIEVNSTCDFKPVVSPNPTKNSLIISSAVFIKNINIISSKGDIVLKFIDVNNHFLNTDISMLQTGIYFVQVEGEYKDKYVTKLIKN